MHRQSTRSTFLHTGGIALAFTLAVLAGCETVDLGEPTMAKEKNLPPSCAISGSDYKMLAYLRDGNDPARTARMVNVLKAKYASAPAVDGENAVTAAQTFVVAKSDVNPVALEQMVNTGCAGK